MKLNLLLIIGVFLLSSFSNYVSQEWQFEKEEEGIKVYLKPVEGSAIPAFKAEAVLKGNMEVLEDILLDFNNVQKWMSSCSYSEVIENPTDSTTIFYSQFDAPWPVTDRDNISEVSYHKVNDDELHINMESIPDFMPSKSNFIRIPVSKGSWKIKRIDDTYSEVTYIMHSERGGSIPNFLSNHLLVQAPIETLKQLQKCLILELED